MLGKVVSVGNPLEHSVLSPHTHTYPYFGLLMRLDAPRLLSLDSRMWRWLITFVSAFWAATRDRLTAAPLFQREADTGGAGAHDLFAHGAAVLFLVEYAAAAALIFRVIVEYRHGG